MISLLLAITLAGVHPHLQISSLTPVNPRECPPHSMPTSFLGLPREIRDLIYEHALVSPTGYITPYPTKRSRPGQFSLHASFDPDSPSNETFLSPKFSLESRASSRNVPSDDNALSISLQRTCRQVYQETTGLIWSNTFLSPDLRTLAQTLKSMGQVPSRQIRSISVSIHTWLVLPKVFALLTSRARHGSFEKLRLDLNELVFRMVVDWKIAERHQYDELLEVLREASKECNFQRSIRIGWGSAREEIDFHTIRDLHLAFGGRLMYEDKLLWENYEQIEKMVVV